MTWRPSNEPLEWVEEHVATGDGSTCVFYGNVSHRPVEEGTLSVFIVPDNPLDELVGVEGRKPVDPQFVNFNYITSTLHLNFMTSTATPTSGSVTNCPPPSGHKIWVRYGWRPPRLRDALVRVKLDGKKQWVPVLELQDALTRSDRPWPTAPERSRAPSRPTRCRDLKCRHHRP